MSQREITPNKKQLRVILKRKRKQLGKALLVTPNDFLAAVIGEGRRTRSEVLNDVWEYIRQHDLFDAQTEQVEADANLLVVFLGRRVVRKKDVARYVVLHVRPADVQRKPFVQVRQSVDAVVSSVVINSIRAYGTKTGVASRQLSYSHNLPGRPTTDLPGPEEEEEVGA